MSISETDAVAFLESLLNKTLRVGITDGRVFVGIFKCTDNESNIILDQPFEYRPGSGIFGRWIGTLVVVPGQHIVKIEVEERAAVGEGGEEGGDEGEGEGPAYAVLITTVVTTTSEAIEDRTGRFRCCIIESAS